MKALVIRAHEPKLAEATASRFIHALVEQDEKTLRSLSTASFRWFGVALGAAGLTHQHLRSLHARGSLVASSLRVFPRALHDLSPELQLLSGTVLDEAATIYLVDIAQCGRTVTAAMVVAVDGRGIERVFDPSPLASAIMTLVGKLAPSHKS